MPARISDQIRREVIRRRILGETFDKIAHDLGISHGAAVTIEFQWKQDIGKHDAESILDFAKMLRKLKISPEDCAEGARICTIMKSLGTKANHMERILCELYHEVVENHVAPKEVVQYLMPLIELSSKFAMPLQEVPEALKSSENKLKGIETQIASLSKQRKDVQEELQSILDESDMTKENICECVEAKYALEELGLSFTRVNEVTNAIQNTKALGNEPAQVAKVFASFISLQTQKDLFEKDIRSNEEVINRMAEKMRIASTELAKLEGLKGFLDKFVGLGFNEIMLERLLKVITQVSSDRGIPLNMAAASLLTEIETSYNTLHGFRNTLDMLQGNLKRANAELLTKETAHAELKGAIDSLNFLGEKGIKENDLIYWQKVFRDYPKLTPQMLTECLRDYADLKEALVSMGEQVRHFEDKLEKLSLEIDSIQKQKIKAEEDLKHTKISLEETRQEEERKLEKLRDDERKLLEKMALDVIQENTKKALLEGITLRAASSRLLPIIQWENGGPSPKPDEVIAAAVYLVHMANSHVAATDPLTADLGRIETALKGCIGKYT